MWENYDTFKLRPCTSEEEENKVFSFYYGADPPYRPAPTSLDEPSVAGKGIKENISDKFEQFIFEIRDLLRFFCIRYVFGAL